VPHTSISRASSKNPPSAARHSLPPRLTFRADPGYLAQARRLLLDNVEHGLTEGAHQLLGVNRADAANYAGPEIFFDASVVVGGIALRNEALN
jgi:hypothetical protein